MSSFDDFAIASARASGGIVARMVRRA